MKPPLEPRDAAIVDELASRKPSELVSLLLELSRRLGGRRRPADVLAHYGRDAFVAPAPLDQRESTALDALALEAAAEYEALLLSPLAPLATCSVVSPTTQDRSVTTSRTTEVVSDPTNVLALECAKRIAARREAVRLCTVHQVVRPQRFPGNAQASWQHFRMFALGEAAPARAEHGFEVDAVVRQVKTFMRFCDLASGHGCRFPRRRARVVVAPDAAAVGDRVLARLKEVVPDSAIDEAPLTSTYYAGLRVTLWADGIDGESNNIADIGLFDWVEKLTSNARLRFAGGGFGIQRVPVLFRPERVGS